MKRLIINADDFGLHEKVNYGILKGYEEGCLTSTSLIASGAEAEMAAALAAKNKGLGTGVHFTFVAEKPVLPIDKVRSLVDKDGRFFENHVIFIKRFLQGKIKYNELYDECEAQLLRVKALGVDISHFDSHQHLHVLPGVLDICLDIAKKHGIKKMRLPAENCFFKGGFPASTGRTIAKCGLTMCACLARFKAVRAGMIMPDCFFGMVAGGNLFEEYFLNILHSLPDGKISEIMIHPGLDNKALDDIYHWNYHWEQELQALLSRKAYRYILDNNIELISFKELQ